MRLVPRSLFSRLVLILMAGLLAAQVLSLALHAHERGRLLAQASGMQSAQRIADIVHVLEPLAPAERRRLVPVLSAPPLLIRLDDTPPPRVLEDAESRTRASFFEGMLRRYLGAKRAVSVVVTEAPPWKAMGAMHRGEAGDMHRGWMHADAPPHSGLSFIATVRLADGTGIVFDSRQPDETLTWPYRLLGSLAILLAAVIALSLLAVRWVTRPLETLTDAAEKLGTNIHQPPLDERGPLEVQRAARAFNSMQAKLIDYLRDRTRILAAISHDLKTPITRLKLRTEMLEDREMRAKFERDLAEMEAMVTSTLDFARGGDADECEQPIDMDALLQSLQRDAQETGHDVTLSGSARAPYPGRPQALKRCLANLIDNAVKYGHCARIAIDDAPERLDIRVSDRGPGIAAADLQRVFEPYYRVDSSRNRDTGGTGLGLSIARNIAEAHGGTLALGKLAEGGMEALLRLPRK